MRLDGAVVVVTGASGGIGRATVRELARHGARLGLIARDPAPLEDVAAELPPDRALTPYCMSKSAVRTPSAGLRAELRRAGIRGVSVCTVLPGAVDTPIWSTAANHTGRKVAPPPPVDAPERVARVIAARLRRPRPETVTGGIAIRLLVLAHRIAPGPVERALGLVLGRWSLHGGTEHTSGALWDPALSGHRTRR
ncbi:SDR family NAD(P)-dependent oxidoreductase [Pseudonocardia alni]|uniref:SDR family NAD(P)-dependent oxidoreductase n=1 Tax=Pseudonocardia alni TaxID=33907 RepID=UPI003407DB87